MAYTPIADWNYYKTEFRAGMSALPLSDEPTFKHFERRAWQSVNLRGRSFDWGDDGAPYELKDWVCAVAELLFTQSPTNTESGAKIIKSFNNAGYSESYGDIILTPQELQKSIRELGKQYVGGTWLHDYFIFTGI
ncbi:MAG: hypothetical protein FWH10_08545 [Oscillospiraceae bacterium]|nr:hypothetical protein [Oscillospiraceae bacterium]